MATKYNHTFDEDLFDLVRPVNTFRFHFSEAIN